MKAIKVDILIDSMITLYSISPQQYLYVDEMLTGPFKKWKHFYGVDNNNNKKQTQVIDEIHFELLCGIIGSYLMVRYIDL